MAGAPGKGFDELGVGGGGQELVEGGAIGADLVEGLLPGASVGRFGLGGPVGVGPLARLVGAVEVVGEGEHVVLGDADVFDDLPGGVREIFRDCTAEFDGEVLDGVVEGGVGVAAIEQSGDFAAEFGTEFAGGSSLGGHAR